MRCVIGDVASQKLFHIQLYEYLMGKVLKIINGMYHISMKQDFQRS